MKFVNRMVMLSAGLALAGCVNAAQQIKRNADAQSYAAAETSARDCPAATALDGRYDATVGSTSFNEPLFDEAVLHYTNARRCALGLSPLASDTGLRRAASGHTADMVRLKFFGHNSPVPGRTTLEDRLNGTGVNYRRAAENLATRSRLRLVSGKQFFVIDRPSCQYTYEQGGAPIQPHSYRTIAEEFVKIWEASPEHRANMFDPKYTRLGTGGSFKDNPINCGDIIATQNFSA